MSVSEIKNIKDSSYSNIKANTVYYFDEIELIDSRDLRTDNYPVSDFLIRFRDKNNELCYAFLHVSDSSEIKDQCESFINGSSSENKILSGCFSGFEVNLSGENYNRHNNEIQGKAVNIIFSYKSKSPLSYVLNNTIRLDPSVNSDNNTVIIATLAICLVALLILINKKKENDINSVVTGVEIVKKFNNLGSSMPVGIACMFISAALLAAGLIFNIKTEPPLYLIGIAGIIPGYIIFYIACKASLCKKMVREIFPGDKELILELDKMQYRNKNFRITESLIVFPGNYIIPKDKIIWMYVHYNKKYGVITKSKHIIIKTTDCKEISVIINSTDEMIFYDMVRNKEHLSSKTIIGYTKESVKYYSTYKKEYKQNKKYEAIK